jgi:DNA-binding beta-propeller fold protein YncE
MGLQHLGHIDLPEHLNPGGFDHAAVHADRALLYVAHTVNHALDVIDCANDRYLRSIPDLMGVAGALVSEERDLVFTSNRGENTLGIFSPDDESRLVKVAVGIRPNGLAYDPVRNLLLAANVGDPDIPGSHTLSLVEVTTQKMIGSIEVPGRTRWTVYDRQTDAFYVNIADPACIVVVNGNEPARISHTFPIPAAGPHGLDLDAGRSRLFCACDGKMLVVLDARSGNVENACDLSGSPDVIFFNATLRHLYVAIGDPGVIEVFHTETLQRIESLRTEPGAHTIAFDPHRNKVYAFLPQTHRTAVYKDQE